MRNYSTDVKRTALEKILRPGARLMEISREMDIPKDTLYGWMRKARIGVVSTDKKKNRGKKLQEKHRIVLEARGMSDEELGRWLREHGLHESQIDAWEQEISSVIEHADGRGVREAEQHAKIRELERELRHKDKALAEMSALVVLKKKLATILGEEPLI